MITVKELSEKLDEYLKKTGESENAFSLRLGIGQSSVNRLINEKQGVSFDNALKILQELGYSFIKRTEENAPLEPVEEEGEGLTTVHVYQKAGAGPAYDLAETEPIFSIKVPFKYFAQFDFAIYVDGHSMEPTIKHESVVGAKTNFNFTSNELYIAQIPYEGLVVKRVTIGNNGQTIIFKSDNQNKANYPDREFEINESEKFILGRVVWIMYRY
jgi:phage repressor protein C with HTH and peptisase S24 domain